MTLHDAYYEPPDEDSQWEEIEENIDYLLKNDNYPYTSENIQEAILNDALIPHTETLADLLSKGETEKAGVVLSSILYTYWEDRTRNEVIDNI